MRILYLDDSGKAEAAHVSKVVCFGGFSIDEDEYHGLVRQISGAKGKYFSARGHPSSWEIKSEKLLTSNKYRKRQRQFCNELAAILKRHDAPIYAALANKKNATKAPESSWLAPLLLQRLVMKFVDEIQRRNTTGTIICDWSTHWLDRHLTSCINTMVIGKKLTNLRGSVSYASSLATPPIQLADVIAGVFRREAEGAGHLKQLRKRLAGQRYFVKNAKDPDGYQVDSVITLF